MALPDRIKSNQIALLRDGHRGLTADKYTVQVLRSPHQSDLIRFYSKREIELTTHKEVSFYVLNNRPSSVDLWRGFCEFPKYEF